jgi:hypothetical protein
MRVVILLALIALPSFAHAECAFQAERKLDIDAAGIDTLKLATGAGDLEVRGEAGLDRIEVRGKACASEEAALAGLGLEQNRSGASVSVSTRIPDHDNGISLWGSNYAYIDVVVRMPATLALEARDSSGDIDFDGIGGNVQLTDSSGDIELDDLGGNATVADTSGDIELRGLAGTFTVSSDSSGDIRITRVKGDALVREDSSGDIDFDDVAGSASVGRDSSGDISFHGIGKDASVGADGSGDVRATDVRGNFTVDRKSGGHDGIRYSDIDGKVSLPPET